MGCSKLPGVALAAAIAWASPALVQARSDAERARDDRIAELERKLEVLADELERTRAERAVPEEPGLASLFGFGPAASKVYQVSRGLSLGAYGEGSYQRLVGDRGARKDSADWTRLVFYAGYKFTDRMLFNSEIEFEHASTGKSGEVSVEFANLDFLLADWANLRAGLLLVPMGFLNEIHEPPFYHGVNRPEVEQRIIPTTWRENGVGMFGSLFGDRVQYQAYVVTSLEASGFTAGGLRGGRQKGSKATAEHLAIVGSLEWYPAEALELGGSLFFGKTGQNEPGIPDALLRLWEVHGQYEARGLQLRALFTMAHLGQAGELTAALRAADPGFADAIADEMLGVYGEVAYDVLPLLFPKTEMSLEPFFRYEYYDTQHDVPSGFSADDTEAMEIHTVGFSFEPVPQVVIKADYRSRDAKGGGVAADEFNLGVGFVF